MNIPIRSEWLKATKLLYSDAERWQFLSACIEYSQSGILPDLSAASEAVTDLFEIFQEGIREATANRERVKKHRNITNNITSCITCNATSNITCATKEKSPCTPYKENTKKTNTTVLAKESGLSFEQLIPELLKTTEFETAWQSWVSYRKEAKKSITRSTAERQLQTLGRYPPQVAVMAIDESIKNGWTGLFPEKITIRLPATKTRDYTKL